MSIYDLKLKRRDDSELKLENQLCFPLYACSKEIIRRYKPKLDEMNLTYTQYMVMLALWERDHQSLGDIGKKIYLDSGTLTPLLKKLEEKGYLTRERQGADVRNLVISLTKSGRALRKRASTIPDDIGRCIDLTEDEVVVLYKLLYKVLYNIEKEQK